MADLIKKIKIKKQDGTYTDYIPIGAEAKNVDCSDGESVEYKLKRMPHYYDSVADMKADINLEDGDMAITFGYYEPNDDGGAEYKITAEKSSVDYQEQLENDLYATLIINTDFVNCKYIDIQKLLKINNLKITTNNKEKTIKEILLDNSNNLEISNSYFKGDTSKSLFHSNSVENLSRKLVVKNSIFTDYLYNQFGYSDDLLVDNSTFANANGTEAGSGYGLLIGHTKNAKINNCYFKNNQRHSVYAGACDNLVVTNNIFYRNRYNLGYQGFLSALNISRGTKKVLASNNKFIECEGLCLDIATDNQVTDPFIEDVVIDSNMFINTIGKDIKVGQQFTTSETLNNRNVIIQNNLFYKNGNYETIHIYNGENIVIKGNTFRNLASDNSSYIVVDNIGNQLKNIIIEDNIFEGYSTNPIIISTNVNTSTCNVIIRNNTYSANNGVNASTAGTTSTNPNMIIENYQPTVTLDNETTLFTKGSNFITLTGTATINSISCNSDELTFRLGAAANITISSSNIIVKSTLTNGNMYRFKKDKDGKWYEI